MQKVLAIMVALSVGALGIAALTTSQQALADKAAHDDRVKQGGLGEYFSEDGRDVYYGGASGEEFGESVQNYARPGDHEGGHETFEGVDNAGENFAYYANGECRDGDCE
jgi:hypothetical protein